MDSKHHQGELEIEDFFPPEDWPVVVEFDQKQLDQLKQRMEELRKSFKPEEFKIDPKRMDELRRQMEEMKALRFGNYV